MLISASAKPVLLVLNPGSSNIKWTVFNASSQRMSGMPIVLAEGQVSLQKDKNAIEQLRTVTADYELGALIVRVVHGGPVFSSPIEVSDESLNQLKSMVSFAPLHNKIAIDLIEGWQRLDNTIRIFAAFDTNFFADLPALAQAYGLPWKLIEKHRIRRYGFHGFAHQDMVKQWRKKNPHRKGFTLVTAQLGSGCSMAAIRDGKPVDTSMGFTPNEGLLMRTRSGDMDPGLLIWLQQHEGWSPDEIDHLLNHEAGWRGLSGGTDNMAELFASDHQQCRLAFDLFRYRFQKTLGAYFAILGGLDGILLSGGIAEHNPALCWRLLSGLSHLGIELQAEPAKSNLPIGVSSTTSKIQCWVVASDEAAMMLNAVQQQFPNDFSYQLAAD